MKINEIVETAAMGSMSAASVAVRYDTPTDTKRRDVQSMNIFKNGIANKFKIKVIDRDIYDPKNKNEKSKEGVYENYTPDYSLEQIYSKLSGIENSSRRDDENAVTYGVEDDLGNLMKVTIKTDQAKDFEVELAKELSDLEAYKTTGYKSGSTNISMAEVLYNLRKKFDIVDVDFPQIPSNAVYKTKEGFEEISPEDFDVSDLENQTPVGDTEALGFEGDGESPENPDNDTSEEGGGVGEDTDVDISTDADSTDEDSNKDFEVDDVLGEPLEGGEPSQDDILTQVIQMLKSEAEARKAQHEAEIEKSKTLQAELSIQAAKEEMNKQEELARMEEEIRQQKEREKQAEEMAKLAKFNITSIEDGISEGMYIPSNLRKIINEVSNIEDETTLRTQRRNLQNIEDPQERALHQQMINIKRRIIQRRETLRREREEQNRKGTEDNARGRDQQQPQTNQHN